MFLGDVQIVRARTAIKAGAEVQIAYVPYDADNAFRHGVLDPHFPKGCPCDDCRRSEPGRAKRAKRHADLVGPSSEWAKTRATLADHTASKASHARTYQVFADTIDLLERSYPSQHGPVKLTLFQAMCEYAVACPNELALEVYDRAFAAAGAEFKRTSTGVELVALPVFYEHNVIQAMVFVAGRYIELGRRADARAWFKAAAKLSATAQGLSFEKFVEEQADAIAMHANHLLVEPCRP